MQTPKEIFKAYDIRGIVGKTLTPEIVQAIGHAIGSEAVASQQKQICVGYDGRLSGPELAAALSRGIRQAGIDVINLGLVATPMVYFAAYHLKTHCGVMVTGSHNPPDYNGLKMVLADETLSGATIQSLRTRIEQGDLAQGSGTESSYDITEEYITRITSDVKLARPMKIAVDCGNGVPGAFAAPLYRGLGCQVEELFCEVDGHFPNHHPDPSVPENLQDLIQALKNGDAEIGLAFDGDGDRLGVVTKQGHIIYPDRQLLLFAEDVLKREAGATIIYDVKSTRNLAPWIKARGGVPLMWKTGHSLVKSKMKETGSALAGEMSGHVFFKERWYGFDDGLYAGARLLEILSRFENPSAVLDALPDSVSTPEQHINMKEGEPHALIAQLQQTATFPGATEVVTIDGLRVEYPDGFGLMRPSNTTPVIVLRFEADNEVALKRIQEAFRKVILGTAPHVELPF
ncbi:MAG TPA: phosphomannomutase/phosphoglucomutase [Methylophilaceae bacterium]|nr:phosphomannomutase/phosphoglucomutase [Methylophilaceae bacterium]